MNLAPQGRLKGDPTTPMRSEPKRGGLTAGWQAISQIGLGEVVLRLGTHTLLVALILFFAWGLREFYLGAQSDDEPGNASLSAAFATPAVMGNSENSLPVSQAAKISDLRLPAPADGNGSQPLLQPSFGIARQAHLHTDVPSRPREEVMVYMVKPDDTLFGIAKQFGLRPETILWANQYVLGDNPHNLRPGQELNILPVDGTYHRWSAGEGLDSVAKFYGVKPEDILAYPANHLNPDTIGDLSAPNIEAGSWLVVPGGRRNFVSWSAPVIPLDNPGVAKVLGPGACEEVTVGVVGAGVFIWPADHHYLSGYGYDLGANHPAIDIDGDEGSPVYASDSGVVVYAGWNNWGYGNVVVINHGNGWQTLYAHLSAYYVTCGQSVFQGNTIAAMGGAGDSAASHLHFEMMFNGVKVDPNDYVK
jgi:murein DD-endopeptidase MepM/ murein hydrolase activator NlpD